MTTRQSLDILLIEDDDIDASLVQRFLRNDISTTYSFQHATTLAEAKHALQSKTFDIILSDLTLPDSDCEDTVGALRSIDATTPIVALTGHEDEEFGLRIIRSGASDYLPKSQLNKMILTRTISYAIERASFIDIEATNQLLESKNERLAELYSMSQQFVDNVSHDFRTPLTVIREFASILRDEIDGPINDRQLARLNSLIARTDELSSMVDDLLDTSQLESGLIRTFRCENDARDIVERVARMLSQRAASKHIEIDFEGVSPGQLIFCDEEKLRRVLINLIVNAIKFTQTKGHIRIFTRKFSDDQLEIVVEDNGPGIPEDSLKNIFERFQKLEAHNRIASCKGFGLGLSIARSLASLNLGELRVASETGAGSQFSVLVPFSRMDSVLNCFIDQRSKCRVGTGELSMTEVVASGYPDGDALEAVDEFLRSGVKSFDLTVRKSRDRWMVLSCNSAASLEQMYARLEEEWSDLKRNCLRVAMPDIAFNHILTHTIPEEKEQFLAYFQTPDETVEEMEEAPDQDVYDRHSSEAHILIVEDEVELASALESRLRSAGFQISKAFDGICGVEAAVEVLPDIIMLDIRMPKMDGLGVLKLLRQIPSTENIPVIVLSASLQDKSIALDRGAFHFIQKPYKSEDVISAVNRILDGNKQDSIHASQGNSLQHHESPSSIEPLFGPGPTSLNARQ
jgi:signal transduction histidine kinase